MTEIKYIKELLSTGTGTEGSLLIPKKIMATLIDEVEKQLIPRTEAAMFFGPAQIPGSSLDVNLTTPNKMSVRVVGEGAEIPLDQTEYTSTNFKPVKYGVAIRITKELTEDSQFNILEHNVRTAGKRFAENENGLVITALDGAANTVSGGASVTIANLTRAMQYLEDSDYMPTTLIIGNEVLNDMRNIDTFVEYSKSGNVDYLQRGFLGTIYGMNVLRCSTNAGMTTTSAYVLDKTQAYAIAEKRPMSLERFSKPDYDMEAAAITQRIVVKILRSSAVCKITSS